MTDEHPRLRRRITGLRALLARAVAALCTLAAVHFDRVTADDYLRHGTSTGRADWAGVVTRVTRDALVGPGRRGRLPVLLHSPGLGEPRAWETTLAADLVCPDGSPMPVARHGLDRPFLPLGKDGETDIAPGWRAFRAHTPGWTRQLTLRGSEHASFTDAEALLPQPGLPASVPAGDLGTIAPAAAIRTTEAYVAAYFDHWLHGRDGRLLERPSPIYPAMEFVDRGRRRGGGTGGSRQPWPRKAGTYWASWSFTHGSNTASRCLAAGSNCASCPSIQGSSRCPP
ncbi:hypothetical protein [Streptomyces sp. NPDC046976]|uniref:hypothetical protein n=1 Tax=Streptomyces sp. NPDC046976 TaxID=3155258 RepID=UPI003405CF0B